MEKKNVQNEGEIKAAVEAAMDEVKETSRVPATKWTPAMMDIAEDEEAEGVVADEPEVVEGDAVFSGLMVDRRKLPPRQRGAKPVYVYEVSGNLRGEEITVSMNPPEKRGFKLLSLVFGGLSQLPLMLVPYSMKDEKGVERSGYTYRVETEDNEGLLLSCKLRAANSSDKSLLECLIAKAQKNL